MKTKRIMNTKFIWQSGLEHNVEILHKTLLNRIYHRLDDV